MNHKVKNVQQLHDSATTLLNSVVKGTADDILSNLSSGIDNLKNNWKGKDAGVRIQEVISVHNAMVSVRNALAQLAADSSAVAANYREIQNANGAGLGGLSKLTYELKSNIDAYSDTADMVDINDGAKGGKTSIDTAKEAMNTFRNAVTSKYNEIMENWTSGNGRDSAQNAFDSFINNVDQYTQTLNDVSKNITTALTNYGG